MQPIIAGFPVVHRVVRQLLCRLVYVMPLLVPIRVAPSVNRLLFAAWLGLKPTYGRVSRYGLIAYASSFDQIGPFTHSVEDAALLMEVISGKDNYDSTSSSSKKLSTYSSLLKFEKKAKIAIFPSTLASSGLHSEVKDAVEDLIADLKSDGHTVGEIDFAFLDHLIATYYVLSTAEASSNLARYDGVHFGYRADPKQMEKE